MKARIDIANYEAYLLDYFEGRLEPEEISALRSFALLHPELNIELEGELPYVDPEVINWRDKQQLLKTEEALPDEVLIAYLEDQLSAEEKKKFESELKQDAGLATTLEVYRKTRLEPDFVFLEGKEMLFRTEQEFLLSYRPVLYTENLLNAGEKTAFEQELLLNKALAAKTAQLANTRMQADPAIVYPNKEELKKEALVLSLFNRRNVMAAAAALLLLLGLVTVFKNKNFGPPDQPLQAKKENKSAAGAEHSVKTEIRNSERKGQEDPAQLAGARIKEKVKQSFPKNQPQPVREKSIESPQLAVNESSTQAVEKQKAVISNDSPASDSELALVKNSIENPAPAEMFVRQDMLPEEEEEEETEPAEQKKGFWKRAVTIARQANGFGLKAVNGDEKGNDSYLLSFNSLSIEKK